MFEFKNRNQVVTPSQGNYSLFYDLGNGSTLTAKDSMGNFTVLNQIPSIDPNSIDDSLTGFINKIIQDAGCALLKGRIDATEYESIIDDLNYYSTVQLDLSTGGYSHGITSNPTLFIALTLTNALCNGSSTGTASVVITGGTGPYTTVFTFYSTGLAANNAALSAGSYQIAVTDSNGVVKAQTFVITEPPALQLTVNVQNASSAVATDGIASAVVNGGVPGYTYVWNDNLGVPIGQTTQAATGLGVGDYQVVVTDSNGCTISDLSVTIAY